MHDCDTVAEIPACKFLVAVGWQIFCQEPLLFCPYTSKSIRAEVMFLLLVTCAVSFSLPPAAMVAAETRPVAFTDSGTAVAVAVAVLLGCGVAVGAVTVLVAVGE